MAPIPSTLRPGLGAVVTSLEYAKDLRRRDGLVGVKIEQRQMIGGEGPARGPLTMDHQCRLCMTVNSP